MEEKRTNLPQAPSLIRRGILLMAHGAPQNLDEVEEYVLRIRHGRPLEPELMATIQDRYRQIGGSPLLHWTVRQGEALQERLQDQKVYIGMKYSRPLIRDVVAQMITDGVKTFRAICLAPQYSNLTIGAYQTALDEALSDQTLSFSLVRSYAKHPKLIHSFAARLQEARTNWPNAFVLFTAHSLPERVIRQGDPYDFEVKETARLVAQTTHLKDWRFAYQSQGMTSEKWLGPTVESKLDELAAQSCTEILVVPVGFVCDHVEILYDIDILYREYAETKGMKLHRVRSLNDSAEFIELLYDLSTSS